MTKEKLLGKVELTPGGKSFANSHFEEINIEMFHPQVNIQNGSAEYTEISVQDGLIDELN